MEIYHFEYDFQENYQGANNDLGLLEEKWLGESLVGYLINAQSGDYMISLVFVSRETPLKFLIRKLEKTPSFAKTEQYKILSAKTSKILKPCYQASLN
jgi:hypothetical protein